MSLNTGFFAAFNQRHKQSTVGFNHHQQRNSIGQTNRSESFLPSIHKSKENSQPYRRNDFANNHLFVTKQRLAKFLDSQSKTDLINLVDQKDLKKKHNHIKRCENHTDPKSTPNFESDVHLSIVNLIMKPSRQTQHKHHRTPVATRLQLPTSRSSIQWINPASRLYNQSVSNYSIDDDDESTIIVNQLIDLNYGLVNSSPNPIDSSVSYIKSLIPSIGTGGHRN